jgi:hypothetical protein
MKRICLAVGLAAASLAASAQNVGVSVNVNQPGFYGRIDIGNVPPPVVVYPQPVVIAPTPVAVHQRPIYLRVPPGHEKHWSKHCAQYGACGQPVYFVREDWYQQHYGRHDRDHDRDGDRREHHDRDKDHGKGHGRGHDKHRD